MQPYLLRLFNRNCRSAEPGELRHERNCSKRNQIQHFLRQKHALGPPRRHQSHHEQAYWLIISAPGRKITFTCRFREFRWKWPRDRSNSQFDVKRGEVTATKVTKMQPSEAQTLAAYLQRFSPTLTCLYAMRGSRVLSGPIRHNFLGAFSNKYTLCVYITFVWNIHLYEDIPKCLCQVSLCTKYGN